MIQGEEALSGAVSQADPYGTILMRRSGLSLGFTVELRLVGAPQLTRHFERILTGIV
jgi:hypothetical protein